jgi:predicted AAA+ superfamily ATPase
MATSNQTFIPRNIEGTLTEAMQDARAVALLGPRQSGKSTLARALADGPMPADYLSLDDASTRSLAEADPEGLIAGLGRRSVIDEIQRVPQLLLAIKLRLDRDPSPGQFLLTGSANLRRIPTVADALPGRIDYLTLWPFTQGEIEGHSEHFISRLFAQDIPNISGAPVGRTHYSQRLLKGGFPEATRRERPPSRTRFFDSYLSTIIEREVADISRVHDRGSVGTLARLIASRSGNLARYDSIAREVGIDGKTAKSHIEVLERLFLIRVRQPWHVNLGKRQVKTPKLYLADTGLMAAIVGADTDRVAHDAALAGALFETFVATELERQASWLEEPVTFWHYREGTREVNVIIERANGEVIAIEVKAGATVRAADFRGLAHMRTQLGARLACGIILYTGERTLPFGKGLWALPLQALWAPL